MVVHNGDSSLLKVEARGSQVQNQSELLSETLPQKKVNKDMLITVDTLT